MAALGTRTWLNIALALFCCPGLGQETTPSGKMSLDSIIEALEKAQTAVHPQVSYQVIREYRLFGASANSEVIAEVDFSALGITEYRIRNSSGSNRGRQVVRAVLDNEVEATSSGNLARTALSRTNYDFTYIGEEPLDGQPCYRLGLKPKRKEKELISGQVWVDKQSAFVRQIEGEVAKTPSWWLKKVRVKLTFADLDGTWLQTGMEAVADVRMLGPHTLTSRVVDYSGAAEVASTGTGTRAAARKQ
jgi:hypothetical protein